MELKIKNEKTFENILVLLKIIWKKIYEKKFPKNQFLNKKFPENFLKKNSKKGFPGKKFSRKGYRKFSLKISQK